MPHQTPFDGSEWEADEDTILSMRDLELVPSGEQPTDATPLRPRVGSPPLGIATRLPPLPPRALASRTDAFPFTMAPDLPTSASEQLATPPGQPQSARRWLPLHVGVIVGSLLSSLAFAALEMREVTPRPPESRALGSAVAPDDDAPRTADFENAPPVVVHEAVQAPESPRKRVRPAAARTSATERFKKPNGEGDSLALLESKLRACAAGQHGTARLQLTVQPSGVISHAVVYGQFEGPEGSCMAKAARGLHLPSPKEPAPIVHQSFSW